MKKNWFLTCLVAVMLAGCASYGRAYKDNTPDAVIQKLVAKQAEFTKRAASGDSVAMFELARINANGWGAGSPNPSQAFDLLHASASAGDQRSQALLGIAYYNGWSEYGVRQDFKQAAYWFDLVLAKPPVDSIVATNYPRAAFYSQVIWLDGLNGPSNWEKAKSAGALALKYLRQDSSLLPLVEHNQGVMMVLEDGASDTQRSEGYELLKRAARADEPLSQGFLKKRAIRWD